MQNRIEFFAGKSEFGRRTITPYIDGTSLPELVKRFERQRGFADVRAYAGLPPDGFKFGPLDQYFMGRPVDPKYWDELGGIYLLACGGCGDIGCWPLVCRVRFVGPQIVWDQFHQPHRKAWDYSSFGPFAFDGHEYEIAVKKLVTDLAGMRAT